jgi:hypothetical protein
LIKYYLLLLFFWPRGRFSLNRKSATWFGFLNWLIRRVLRNVVATASGEHARTVQHLTTYLTTGPAQVKEDFFNRAQALGFYPFAVVDRAEDDAPNKRGNQPTSSALTGPSR